MDESFEFNGILTAAGSSGDATEQTAEGIAAVLIKQLHDSRETSVFTMFGKNFNTVCCLVVVRSIEQTSTRINYVFEDHTGRIEGHYWLEDGEDADSSPNDIKINNYAKVYGCLRSKGGNKTLMISRLMNIEDPNEISTHILEVLHTRFKTEEDSNQNTAGCGDKASSVSCVN